jgi:hypothetical protein
LEADNKALQRELHQRGGGEGLQHLAGDDKDVAHGHWEEDGLADQSVEAGVARPSSSDEFTPTAEDPIALPVLMESPPLKDAAAPVRRPVALLSR